MVITTAHWTPRRPKRPTEHLCENIIGVKLSLLGSIGRSELVKVLTLLGIAQDLIGLLDLFELLGVTALIGVVLAGKFAVSLFDVVGRRVSRQP
jgi:hypothetical protein